MALRRMKNIPAKYVDQVESIIRLILPPSEGSASILVTCSPPAIIDPNAPLLSVFDCLTSTETRWTDGALIHSPVPPLTWLHDLETALDGCESPVVSIRHPTVPDLYAPPWALYFWFEYLVGIQEQNLWKTAKDSLERLHTQGVDGSSALRLMDRVPWQMALWCEDDDTSLVGIISELLIPTAWLRERHLNAYATYLNFCGREDGWWIGRVGFSNELKKLAKPSRMSPGQKGLLHRCREDITSGQYDHIVFPANINDNHWIVFEVDVKQRWFRYGMPLLRCSPSDTLPSDAKSRELAPKSGDEQRYDGSVHWTWPLAGACLRSQLQRRGYDPPDC